MLVEVVFWKRFVRLQKQEISPIHSAISEKKRTRGLHLFTTAGVSGNVKNGNAGSNFELKKVED